MTDRIARSEPLAEAPLLCEAARVIPSRIELRWRDVSGLAERLEFPIAPDAMQASAEHGGLTLAARVERAGDETVVRAVIGNRGEQPVRLEEAAILVATGIGPDRATRFFKHGYQSWSPCSSAIVGANEPHYRDSQPALVRVVHQSEVARPPEAPEAATSELLTVVEAEGIAARRLAGFIGTASQLTTLTVPAPGEIRARALFDGIALKPGEARQIEPLLLVSADESTAALAARWAARAGAAMRARIGAPYQRGWCSWYHYFHGITEDALRANLRALAAMRDAFPLEVVQLDDGFQSALGDWDTTNAKFPSGLGRIAEEIRGAGFQAGIWTAPFFAARDSRLMREHPEWFIRHQSGAPLRAGYNPNWTTDREGFAYALDASHPAFAAHLEGLFRKLVAEFGYSYLKLDFLYAASAEGVRHDPKLTRAETLRRGLEAIRAGAGERTFILGCGCPIGPAIGVVDAMRIGEDVAPAWKMGTRQAIDAVVARSFMHRRLWLNDPDCLMLRERDTSLNAEERGALAAAIAASGGMLLISDDMALLGSEQGAAYQGVARIGAEVDADSAREPALAADLLATGPIRVLRKELPDGALVMVLNRGEQAERVALSELRLGAGPMSVVGPGGSESDADASLSLPPHSARIVRVRRAT